MYWSFLTLSLSSFDIVRKIHYVDSVDELPKTGTEFNILNYYCIKPDRVMPIYDQENATDFLYPKKMSTILKSAGKTILFNPNGMSSVDSIKFNTSFYTYKNKISKEKISTYHKSDTNCTSDGLENYTIKINHVCDESKKFDIISSYKRTKCEYVIRASSRKLCRHIHYSHGRQLQKIQCIEKSKIPPNFFN